ncbi:hypothetical protein [Cytobacillus praedii]|uniref:hypothetical protein n=1 Tax=Cytobacillus praedii TaxID=1742358 RepID=UPI003AF53D3A
MNKKIASKLVVSSALVSSAFVSTINVDAAAQSSSAEKWVKEAENLAGTLKWAISIESANTDITEIPWDYYNQTKDALKKAREAIKSLPVKERTILETRLNENVELYVSTNPNKVGRVVAYIDAVTAGKKIEEKKKALAEKLQKNEIDNTTEKAYHELTKEIRKQGILLDRVYGYSTRQIIRDHFKKSAEQVKEEALYPVSIKIEIDRANEATAAGKYEEAKKRLESANYFLERGIEKGFIKRENALYTTLSEKINASTEYYKANTETKVENPSSGGGGGGYVPPADYIVNGTTATVRSAVAFEKALGEGAIKDIKLAASFGDANKVYKLNRIVNVDFGSYTLNGDLTIETRAEEGTIKLKGSGNPAIRGNLTVNGSNLTVNNSIVVSGEINLLDVKAGTWNENAEGNKLTIEDKDAIVNLKKNTGRITVKGKATESTTINVGAGVTVASLVADNPVHIKGEGVVAAAVINANVIMGTLPERIFVEDGFTITKSTGEQYTSEELNAITDNKLVLEFIIEDAKSLNKNTVAGTKPGQVSQAAKDALGTAITTAEGILNDTNVTDVTNAVTALEIAIATFEKAIVTDDAEVTPLEQAIAAKENFKTAYASEKLDWDTLITAIHYLNEAEKAGADVKALKDYYAGIDSLDMSNKDTSRYDISTGALVDFTGLTNLDLSGVTSITELGGLVGLTKLTTLNISGTKVKELNVLWNETEARFPDLTNLQAENIDTLTSIGGLVEVTNAAGFSPAGLTWNLSGSILAEDPHDHIGYITTKFQNSDGTFTAPKLAKSTPLEQAIAAKGNFETAYANGTLDWDTLITAIYYLNEARAAKEEVSDLEAYYAGIESLDMSNKDTSKYAISTGALVDFTGLTNLDLSGVTNITELGGLVGATDLTTLNISGTKVKELNVLWNETEARFPDLTNLQAENIDTLTSIGGLVEVTNVAGFSPAGLTWNLSGSILAEDPHDHIGHITSKFTNGSTFTAPMVKDSAPAPTAETLNIDETFTLQDGIVSFI